MLCKIMYKYYYILKYSNGNLLTSMVKNNFTGVQMMEDGYICY